MTEPVELGRILVTGASGFVGTILGARLMKLGFELVGVGSTPHSPERDGAYDRYIQQDLTEAPIEMSGFDGVIHLAGLAEVGPSFDQPQRYINQNSAIMTNLCESLLKSEGRPRTLIVSSGAIYGSTASGAIDEDTPPVFTSPYVVSKVLVENQASYYRARGLDIVVARPFNHIGPGQRSGFIVPDLVRKLKALAPGEPLLAGNLDSQRDYTDVRDIVNGYVSLLTSNLQHSVYNVASGRSISGWEVLRAVSSALGIAFPQVQTHKGRFIDPAIVQGNADRIRSETGWEPHYSLNESVLDYVQSLGDR